MLFKILIIIACHSLLVFSTGQEDGLSKYASTPRQTPLLIVVPIQVVAPEPQYHYGYYIKDPQTGDMHSQQERRNGNYVTGQYSVLEEDGSLRIVRYYDQGQGFNVIIEKRKPVSE
ncbi:hypothetical protein ABEB36_013096 [Hypothenemus hampei]|uniref:Uncharacterized protein n=1 Tax=Hypothenemus hampei TaxID=57062 RepID=A0ABD1E7N0_HYPHA